MTDKAFDQKLLKLFTVEAEEAIWAITRNCLALEKQPDAARQSDLLTRILRKTHDLKGLARAMGYEKIVTLTHRLETLFEALKERGVPPKMAVYDLIYQALDGISSLAVGAPPGEVDLNALPDRLETAVTSIVMQQTAVDPPSAVTGAATEPFAVRETIRVSVDRVEAILNLVNELQVARLNLEHSLGQMGRLIYESEPVWESLDGAQIDDLYRQSEANFRHLNQLLSGLHEYVRQARMLPLATVFEPLPRLTRSLARELGKMVTLHLEGGDIELDRAVLEQIKSPLQHLLQNSIDHGLEPPAVRRAAGKPETARISITAVPRGSSILIKMKDDGAGLDVARIKERAVSRRLLTIEEAAGLDEQETITLLFRPGFSLADTVTAVSGRGVGLDVVRQAVESLRGSIVVENYPGEGLCFSLILPISIATSPCLLVQANDQIFALPARHVTHLLRIQPAQVQDENGRLLLAQDGAEAIPAVSLAHLLLPDGHLTDSPAASCRAAVLIDYPERPFALLVDELCEVREIIIKKAPPPIVEIPFISGASILGTGAVILVLNVIDLMKAVKHHSKKEAIDP